MILLSYSWPGDRPSQATHPQFSLSISLVIAWLSLLDNGLRLSQPVHFILPLRSLYILLAIALKNFDYDMAFNNAHPRTRSKIHSLWLSLTHKIDSSLYVIVAWYPSLKWILPSTGYCNYSQTMPLFSDLTLTYSTQVLLHYRPIARYVFHFLFRRNNFALSMLYTSYPTTRLTHIQISNRFLLTLHSKTIAHTHNITCTSNSSRS